jgi:hypothetical protein
VVVLEEVAVLVALAVEPGLGQVLETAQEQALVQAQAMEMETGTATVTAQEEVC